MGSSYQFALEYERSPKVREKYARVRQDLEKEAQVDSIVYVMPAYPLRTRLTRWLWAAAGCDRFPYAQFQMPIRVATSAVLHNAFPMLLH
jgi:hypothetical protein